MDKNYNMCSFFCINKSCRYKRNKVHLGYRRFALIIRIRVKTWFTHHTQMLIMTQLNAYNL